MDKIIQKIYKENEPISFKDGSCFENRLSAFVERYSSLKIQTIPLHPFTNINIPFLHSIVLA